MPWWLPSASSTGCADWVLILNVGTASTGAPTEFLHFLGSVCVFSGLLGWRIQIRRVMHDPPFLWAVSRNCPYVSSEVAVPIVSGLLREAPTEHSVPDLRLLPCRFLQTFSALEMSECQNRSASSSRNLKKTEMHSFRGPIPLVRTPSTSSRCSPVRSRRTFAAVRVAS